MLIKLTSPDVLAVNTVLHHARLDVPCVLVNNVSQQCAVKLSNIL